MDGVGKKRKVLWAFLMVIVTGGLVALDQWIKVLAEQHLAGRGYVRIVGEFIQLVFVKNSGAFLAIGSGLPQALRIPLLVILPIAALSFLSWTILVKGFEGSSFRAGGAAPRKAGIAEYATFIFIASGGAGNLIDRIAAGEVRDFLQFRFFFISTGIMNLADLYITAAVVIIVVVVARRSLHSRRAGSPDSGALPPSGSSS